MGYLTLAAAPNPEPAPLFDRLTERQEHYHKHARDAADARRRGDIARARELEREAERAWSTDF